MAMPLLAALCATLLLTGCAGAEPAMDVATSGPEVAVVPDGEGEVEGEDEDEDDDNDDDESPAAGASTP